MGVCRRAALYLARKKGKSLLLFLVFFAVSALLLLCVSVVEGTGQAARELRSSVGASFTIRPYAQMTLEDGEITQAAAPVVSQESIDQILAAAQGQVKAYNTEQYGYAKSQQLHFLPGAGDNTASNMGQVTAVRDSQLLDVFREEEYTLLAGRHSNRRTRAPSSSARSWRRKTACPWGTASPCTIWTRTRKTPSPLWGFSAAPRA